MVICVSCGKKPRKISWSRHQKGSSGASVWPLRAQISKRTQHPNLHVFRGKRYCTKCLRQAKQDFKQKITAKKEVISSPAV